jgi:hypothetical protein
LSRVTVDNLTICFIHGLISCSFELYVLLQGKSSANIHLPFDVS